MIKFPRLSLILILVSLNLILVTAFFLIQSPKQQSAVMPELKELTGREDFATLKTYFSKLAHNKGAVYAYEVLKRIPVANGIDMHLMGHIVGDILFKQKGAEGMAYCTRDFRNACAHTIVIGLFSEKGLKALPEIVNACKHAPGGKGAYNMCFHGLGHGILAYTAYDLPKAVDICSKIKKEREDGREFSECVGGTIMEIISGGDHDKQDWIPMHRKYMGTSDPLYPCDSDMIPSVVKTMCYTYITPHLFDTAGADGGFPTVDEYKTAFKYCDALDNSDPNRMVCYGGFGKEFVVLARGRDIRNVSEMSIDELKKVKDWCNFANDAQGKLACIESALQSLYWGGENDIKASIKLCNIMENGKSQDDCFDTLIGMVDYYVNKNNVKEDFCRNIPAMYNEHCRQIL